MYLNRACQRAYGFCKMQLVLVEATVTAAGKQEEDEGGSRRASSAVNRVS